MHFTEFTAHIQSNCDASLKILGKGLGNTSTKLLFGRYYNKAYLILVMQGVINYYNSKIVNSRYSIY